MKTGKILPDLDLKGVFNDIIPMARTRIIESKLKKIRGYFKLRRFCLAEET